MRSWFRSSSLVPIGEQLARLAEHGIRLRTGVTAADVTRSLKDLKADAPGFSATLSALGAASIDGQRQATFLSDDVWYFDAACITGPGAYAYAVARIAQLLPEEFPAREATDSIDIADWRASVSFELGEERLHWTQRVLDAWIDETLFVRVNQLIDAHGGPRMLWQVPLPGRQRLLVAATPAHGRRLAQVCKLALRKIV